MPRPMTYLDHEQSMPGDLNYDEDEPDSDESSSMGTSRGSLSEIQEEESETASSYVARTVGANSGGGGINSRGTRSANSGRIGATAGTMNGVQLLIDSWDKQNLSATGIDGNSNNNGSLIPSNSRFPASDVDIGKTAHRRRKMVKLKMWDPGDPMKEPAIVSVQMEIPTRQQDEDSMQQQHKRDNVSLGVGQTIELQRKKTENARGSHVNEGKNNFTVDMWQPHLPQHQNVPFSHTQSKSPHLSQNSPQSRSHHIVSLPPSGALPLAVTHNQKQHNSPMSPLESPQVIGHKIESFRYQKRKSIQSEVSSITNDEATQVKGLQPFTIPSILSATVVKRSPNEKVGLAFRKANGTVVLEKIIPGSAFDGSVLRPGHECLCINGHRVRSARRAAELVRESTTGLTMMVSNAPRPPGTMYTIIQCVAPISSPISDYRQTAEAAGMHFKMKHGLVQMVKADFGSPILSTSMKAGDFVLAINGFVIGTVYEAVKYLSEAIEGTIPILYFNMRQLRMSLVDKVIGDLWKKEWNDNYDECVVLQPGGGSSPLTLRFKEEGMCEIKDPLRAFRVSSSDLMAPEDPLVPPDHPLHSVVETLNHGTICVLAAIREGVELATTSDEGGRELNQNEAGASSGSNLMGNLAKLADMYNEGLLSKEDFESIKSKLLS